MEADIITVDEAQEVIASHEKFKNTKDQKAKKKAPKPEEVRSAVAAVVLAELEMWPEGIQSLIGDQHPAKEAFEKGVPYIIGAYMHIAEEALRKKVREQIREAEVKTAKRLGPLAKKVQDLKDWWRRRVSDSVRSLEIERNRKLKEAKTAIRREYEGKMAKARNLPQPEELPDLEKEEKDLKEAFETYKTEVEADAAGLFVQIHEIDKVKDKWNSKKRRARRLQKKGDGEAEAEV